MGSILQYRQNALKNVQMANYLLSTTYPMIKEPKTLLSISDHVFSSFMSSVSALLAYERNKKLIPPYHDTDESKLNSFKQNLVKKYKFGEYLRTMEKIKSLSTEHKNSSVEFTRDMKYVICADGFNKIQTVSEQDVKGFIREAKDFIGKMDAVISNE